MAYDPDEPDRPRADMRAGLPPDTDTSAVPSIVAALTPNVPDLSGGTYGTASDAPPWMEPFQDSAIFAPEITREQAESIRTADLATERNRFDAESRIIRDQERDDEKFAARQERLLAAQGMTADDLKPWNPATMAPQKHDLWEQFGSPGFLVAMMASSFTAMPMVSALNSGAAAMNAINQGDMDAYDRAFKEWQEHTKLVLHRMEIEQKAFDEISHLRTSNREEYKDRLTATMAKFNDERGLNLLANGYDEKADEAIEGRRALQAKLAQAQWDLLRNNARLKAIQSTDEYKNKDYQGVLKKIYEFDLMSGTNKDAQKNAKEAQQAEAFAKLYSDKPEEYWSLSESQRFRLSQLWATYKPDFSPPERPGPEMPPAGMTREQYDYAADLENLGLPQLSAGWSHESNYKRQQIHAHALQRAAEAGLSPGDLVMRRSELKAETSTLTRLEQMRSAVEAFSTTGASNGRVLVNLANKVDSSGVPTIERWVRAGKKELAGDADVSMFNAQMVSYRSEVAKVINNPNLTGVLTNEARQEAASFLNGNDTAEQVDKVTGLMEQDFERRRAPLQAEIDHVMDAIRGKVYQHQTLPPRETDTTGYKEVPAPAGAQ